LSFISLFAKLVKTFDYLQIFLKFDLNKNIEAETMPNIA